jgi:hypothetical protein
MAKKKGKKKWWTSPWFVSAAALTGVLLGIWLYPKLEQKLLNN